MDDDEPPRPTSYVLQSGEAPPAVESKSRYDDIPSIPLVVTESAPDMTSNTHFGLPYSYDTDSWGNQHFLQEPRDYNSVVDEDLMEYFSKTASDPENYSPSAFKEMK